ncbi:peptidase S1 [Halobacillus andaensis]|uniref:Peptidase S1 n=1 Tax=Halobacillus andaensis TaxID=1176239 RepID=A0A917B0N7_HALAA|nr:trypsin-like peptidase domain-containing protein [Halobacillus andaensis]MBP2003734.1 S1-C subfamily serine protease [Halobacillus andaensis]GGF12808.1 peptidase S1 [Halobacillus andaensis]
MKRAWVTSSIVMAMILIAGIASFVWIQHQVPSQLEASSVLDKPMPKEEEGVVTKSTQEIIYESQKLVVQIELDNGTIGSGFLYNDKGDVITNAHVVANTEDVQVINVDSKEMSGKVIGSSRSTDIAVVRVPDLEGKDPLAIQESENAPLLTEVLALGSPLGLQNTVTRGEISGLDRNFELDPFTYEDVYQISAPISPGNSGGPLLNAKTGEVIGINSAKLGDESIGFSIPVLDILPMVKQWSKSPMEELPEYPELADGTDASNEQTDADQATYLVQYFYDSINQGDFVTAYSLLGTEWQENKSYEEFREGYYNTLSVSIDQVVADPEGEEVAVNCVITTEETIEGEIEMKKYNLDYTLGYENDQMMILSGEGKEID